MYLCYLDESGTPETPGTTSHFVLCGLAIPAKFWNTCEKTISEFKNRWDISESEIHVGWMLRPYYEQQKISNFENLSYTQRRKEVLSFRKKEFYRIKKEKHKTYKQIVKSYRKTEPYIHLTYNERKTLINEFAEIISSWEFARLFAECIDKVYFNPDIGSPSVSGQAFEQVVSRFEQFLQITSTSRKQKIMGMIIHDNNPTMAKKLTDLMLEFHRMGTLWTTIERIIETPVFVDSKLTCMVQVADLCSYTLRRYLENDEKNLFDLIFKRADRKDDRVVGIRHYTDKSCNCLICQTHTNILYE